jgi:hypothetical protein
VADDNSRIQDFVFSRELAEVYLLLDNVSTDDSKVLPASPNADPLFAKEPGKDWIQQICEIGWPPEGSAQDQALDAAKLIRARDILNRAAAPASGSTIAFTLLVAGDESSAEHPGKKTSFFTRLRHLWQTQEQEAETLEGEVASALASPTSPAATPVTTWAPSPTPTPTPTPVLPYRSPTIVPSRQSLAKMAFPSLFNRSRNVKAWFRVITIAMAVGLLLTCILQWNVTYGAALLHQYQQQQLAMDAVSTEIAAAEDRSAGDIPPPTTTTTTTSPPAAPPASVPGKANVQSAPTYRFCHDKAVQMVDGTMRYPGLKEQRLCERRAEIGKALALAMRNMRGWYTLGYHPAQDGQGVNDQEMATWLDLLAGAVLPICYGMLGAAAAVVRNFSSRMRDSLLAPRDLWLATIQLTLGAVIGACVGLFVAPPGDGAGNNVLGSIHLTASALCFLAGFGVEGVFVTLEGLVGRVFNSTPPPARQPG